MPPRLFDASRVPAVSPVCPLPVRLGGANEPSRRAQAARPLGQAGPCPYDLCGAGPVPGRVACAGHRPSKLLFLCPSLSCDTLATVIGHMLVKRTGF